MSSTATVSPAKPAIATLEIAIDGMQLLEQMATSQGVSPRYYLECLLQYAGSRFERPGSWEAERPFDFYDYDDRTEDGQFADRWFTSDEKGISRAQREFDAHCESLRNDIRDLEKSIADWERDDPEDAEYITNLKEDLEQTRKELTDARIEDFQW